MPCDHLGPVEVIALAEKDLGGAVTPGIRFRHAENTPGGMWASVVIEIERRDAEWIVTRLDRNQEPVPAAETGLFRL
ncbi:MAG: hypothetical protein JJE51_01430 [Thermoanaerobaculia bacterium]|nr:hypothetical protein [Thermoanaerobaculia bacterium]